MDKEPQIFKIIQLDALLATVQSYKDDAWRLGQMCATAENETVELLYTFIKKDELENLEIHVAVDAVVPSISSTYLEAFFYENEVHDLFGIGFSGVAIDYMGKFYKTSIATPQNPKSAAAVEAARKAGVGIDIKQVSEEGEEE